MSNGNKEAKKEELLEKQEARQLTEEELEQVTGGSYVPRSSEQVIELPGGRFVITSPSVPAGGGW